MTGATRFGLTRPTEADIRAGGFSTPWDAPMIPPFPFRFRNAEVLTLYWRTDPAAMASSASCASKSSAVAKNGSLVATSGTPRR